MTEKTDRLFSKCEINENHGNHIYDCDGNTSAHEYVCSRGHKATLILFGGCITMVLCHHRRWDSSVCGGYFKCRSGSTSKPEVFNND